MATVARLLPHLLSGAGSRAGAPTHRRLIIVADEPLGGAELRSLFPRIESAVLVRDASAPPAGGGDRDGLSVHEVAWDPHVAGGFSARAQRVLRGGGVAVFLKPHAQCSGRMLRDLRRCGVRTALFDECGRWRRTGVEQAILAKFRLGALRPPLGGRAAPLLQRLGAAIDRSLLRIVRAMAMDGSSGPRRGVDEEAIARLAPALGAIERPDAPRKQVKRVMHFVSSLDSGGAERQVVHLAASQSRRGLDPVVRTQSPLSGHRAHYLPLLAARGVEARQAGSINGSLLDELECRIRDARGLVEALRRLPTSIRAGVLDIFGELMLDPPDVLHCWLDEPNVLGGVAGLLAGVPRIVLSTRNVNPSHFPHLHHPWMRPWYRFLATRRRIVFAGNSAAGIADYARWLGIDESRFILLRNAVPPEAFAAPAPEPVEVIRREIGLDAGQPLIVGVMRLSIEKRPDLFVETIRRVRLVRPGCRAAIVGVGPLEGEVRRQIASLRLDGAITLLGQRRDVNAILAAADVVLLTSDHEGTPNSLLEALALERAVVATDAGGVAEVIEHGQTGLLAERGDAGALAAAISRLLDQPELRARCAEAGRAAVRERFALGAVLDQTLAAYVA